MSLHNVDAERVVLGMMMRDAVVPEVVALVDRAAFYSPRHADVFAAIVKLHEAGEPTGPVAVADRMDTRDLDRVGGAPALLDMIEAADSPGTVGYFVGILVSCAQRRRTVETASRVLRLAEADDPNPGAVADAIVELVECTAAQGRPDESWPPRYGDVTALLDGAVPVPPQPEVLHRVDGRAVLYRRKVNVLFGDSESGKTWIALAAVVEVLDGGGRAAFIDLDHNGMEEIANRLVSLGANSSHLCDVGRFRYCEPADAEELKYFVGDLAAWGPDVTVVDSLGEVLPMLGLSSNSPDDYTEGNRKVLTPLAAAGAAVIVIDHLPKDDAAREKGQTGTTAKRRTVNGVTLRVTVRDAFTPGHGGSANLTIYKDRPGGLRGACPRGKTPPAGRFVMDDNGAGALSWHVTTPSLGANAVKVSAPDADVAELDALAPAPRSQRDVQERKGWGGNRALRALQRWRELHESRVDAGLA